MSVIHMDGFGHYVTGTNTIQNDFNTTNIDPRFQTSTSGSILRSTSAILPRSEGAQIFSTVTNPSWVTYSLPQAASAMTVGIGYYFVLLDAPVNNNCVLSGFGLTSATCIAPNVTSSGTLRVRANNTSGTAGSTVLLANTLYHLEMKVVKHASTGTVEIRLNGNTECTFTGNTTTPNYQGLSLGFKLAHPGTRLLISDLYVWQDDGQPNSDWLGERLVHTLNPVSDVANSWTLSAGSNVFSLINETPRDNDTTYVETDTVTNEFEVGMSNLPSVNYTPLAVCAIMWAEKTNTGASDVDLKIKSGSGEIVHTESLTNGQYLTSRVMANVDPNGNIPWTASAVNALTVAVEKVV